MALHPLVQQKAQNEIQRIFGPDYIPSFEDAENLPYVTAVVLELFRWVAPVPTGEFVGFFLIATANHWLV
jgi:cytochrome P450